MSKLTIWCGELTTLRGLRRRGLFYISPGVFWILLFLAIPGLALVLISLMTRGDYGQIEWIFTLENYKRLAGYGIFGWSADYLWILWRSIWVAFVTTVVCVLLSYPLAFFIAMRPPSGRGRGQ